jgi:hypothetical protein
MKIAKSLTVLLVVTAAVALLNCGGGGGGSGGGSDVSTSSNPSTSSATPVKSKYPIPFSETPPPALPSSMMMATFLHSVDGWGAYGLDAADWKEGFARMARSAAYAAVSIAPTGNYYAFSDQEAAKDPVSLLFDGSGKSVGSGVGMPRWTNQTDQSDQYAWTADEKNLYYGVYYDGLYRVDTATGVSRQVVKSVDSSESSTVFDHSIAVSPDNAYLVWFHHEYGKYANIFVVDPSKLPGPSDPPILYKQATNIIPFLEEGFTEDGAIYDEDTCPVFIDNRNMIFAYTRWTGVNVWTTRLYKLNPETGAVEEFATLSTGPVRSLSLSHDKTRLLVCGSTRISVVDMATRYENVIDDLNGYSTNRAAAWSPDDRYFAVATLAGGGTLAEILLYEPSAPIKWRLNQVSAGGIGGFAWVKQETPVAAGTAAN